MKHSTPAVLCCLAGLFAAGTAGAQELYSNGPFVTHPGAHASGADVSLAQDVTYPGYTALGYSAGPEYRMADDFNVPDGEIWTVNGLRLFAYQEGSGDAAFTDARVIIWRGIPEGFTSTKVFDGAAINALVSSTPGAYRIAQSNQATAPFTDTARRVMTLLIAIPDTQLSAGNYWVDWQLTGPQAEQVRTPPVSIIGQPYTSVSGFMRLKCPATSTNPACPANQWWWFENGSSPYLVDAPFVLEGSSFDDRIFKTGFEALPATP